MAILPIDLQAIMLRMDNLTRLQQQQHEGVIAAQMVKAEELSELAQLESNSVNEVRPNPDDSSKIEEKEEKASTGKRRQREGEGKKSKEQDEFEEPYKGTIIDTKR
jgi:hypothetical protein